MMRDLIAAVSIAGLLLPEAIAYAGMANMPPQAGLVALFAGLLCYGALGSSRFAIVSATSSSAALIAAFLSSMPLAGPGLRSALAAGMVIATGLAFLLAAVARLGDVSAFIAKPVVRGFAFGLALNIIIRQWPALVGVHPAHADLPHFLPELIARIREWNPYGLALGLGALLLMQLGGRKRSWPAAMLVILASVALARFVPLASFGIAQVGPFAWQLGAPVIPELDREQWLRIGELSMAVVLILYAESYSSIRSLALKHGDSSSPNQDLLALGLSNLIAGLFGGLAVGAGFSASSANEAAGARSKQAGLLAALLSALIVAGLLPWVALIPQPVLAAIVIHAVSHALRRAPLRPYFKWRRDRLVLLAAVAGVLLLGVLDGLLLAIALSLTMTLRGFGNVLVVELGHLGEGHSYLPIQQFPDARPVPGLLVLRPDEPLFFANIDKVCDQVLRLAMARRNQAESSLHTLILSLEESPNLDGSSIEGLQDLASHLASQGVLLAMTRLKDKPFSVLSLHPVAPLKPDQLSALSVADAVERYRRPPQP